MKRKRTIISKLIGLGLLIVFCWSGVYLTDYALDEYQMYKLEKQLDLDKPEAISISKKQEAVYNSEKMKKVDFTKLEEKNGETVGWITIDGTAVDYPVVQADDNSYYLTHDFNNDPSIQGSIFMDYRNHMDIENQHTILYGHNMKNGTMFHDLNKYKEESFLNEHTYVTYYGQTGYYKWEIFSTYNTNPSSDYLQTEFGSGEQYISFINQLVSQSDFAYKGESFSEEDQILTLSTCSEGVKNGRRVIHARLIEERPYDE